jgi:hypothetical protein
MQPLTASVGPHLTGLQSGLERNIKPSSRKVGSGQTGRVGIAATMLDLRRLREAFIVQELLRPPVSLRD